MTANAIVECLLEDKPRRGRVPLIPAVVTAATGTQPAAKMSISALRKECKGKPVAGKMPKRNHAFDKLCAELPNEVQNQARDVYAHWCFDPFNRELEFKKIQRNTEYWSVQIGRAYRAICWDGGNVWIWRWIGTHEAYNKVLNQIAGWKPPTLP